VSGRTLQGGACGTLQGLLHGEVLLGGRGSVCFASAPPTHTCWGGGAFAGEGGYLLRGGGISIISTPLTHNSNTPNTQTASCFLQKRPLLHTNDSSVVRMQ